MISTSLILLIAPVLTQITEQPEMADLFRNDGKIYIVISVILIIFLSLFIYLIKVDKKIKKIAHQQTLDKK